MGHALPVDVQRFAVLFAICAVTFASFPTLDLMISGLFHDGTAFTAGQSEVLERLRMIFMRLTWGMFLLAVVMWVVAWRAPARALAPLWQWRFIAVFYLAGPGLLANQLLKGYAGRARPEDVDAFGGDKRFTPAFQWTDQCPSNCSFVSGEASGGAAFAIAIFVLTAGMRDAGLRAMLRWGAVILCLVMATLRVIKGRHFASDALFAVLLMIAVALVLERVLPRGERGQDG